MFSNVYYEIVVQDFYRVIIVERQEYTNKENYRKNDEKGEKKYYLCVKKIFERRNKQNDIFIFNYMYYGSNLDECK